jgi:DNA helicase-2/ATP-dependent DNA helicase PcrA
LERETDFKLEDDFSHVLVDEYQDLNKCDQSIIRVLAGKGAEVYVAGDDDQSIYGFRQANPNGIRVFTEEYPKTRSLTLMFCKRCDKSILTLSEFVANLDIRRLPKSLMPAVGAAQGEVRLLKLLNQYSEARCVARLCKLLINSRGYKAEEILILLRSDLNGRYCSVLADAFRKEDVPLALNVTPETPLDTDLGREFISLLRLCQSKEDSLAWRTLLQVRKNNIGSTTIAQIYELARERGSTFTQALRLIETNPSICNGYGPRVVGEVKNIETTVQEVSGRLGAVNLEPDVNSKAVKLVEVLAECSQLLIDDKDFRTTLDSYVVEIVTTSGATDLESLLSMLSIAREDAEQRVTQNAVNIMTMHKAKGLSADIVFVVAAEDELIPGRQEGQAADDERRLLYVSLTRARHQLLITYCINRIDGQMYSGSKPGKTRRSLTRFLRDSPLQPLDGEKYLATQN